MPWKRAGADGAYLLGTLSIGVCDVFHKTRFLFVVAAMLITLIARPSRAQAPPAQPSADELRRASALLTQGDWENALDSYTKLANKYPALPQFHYRIAQALAELKHVDAAIAELKRSAAGGMPVTASSLTADAHLTSLKSHANWPAVLDAFDAVTQPCMHDPKFREFDFWVGDWDVRGTAAAPGGPASRNNITLEDNGCVVMEHYTTPSGYQGQSFNIFDRSVAKWRQTWIDNTGGQHDYRGELVSGNMVLVGDTPAPNSALGRVPTRLTLFHVSKDSVRQFSETSADGGKTWQTAYDLMYVRRR